MPPEATPQPKPAEAPKPAAAKPDAAASPPPANGASAQTPPVPAGSGETPPPEPAKAKDRAELRREGFKLRQERKAIKDEREGFKTQLQQLQAQIKALEGTATEAQKLKADREAYLRDPIRWAAENGGPDAEKSIRGYVEQATPEKAIRESYTTAEQAKAETARLAKELEDFKAQQVKDREEAQKRQAEAHRDGSATSFSRSIMANAAKYPYLSTMYSEAQIKAKALEFHDMAFKAGESYTFDEVADAFEKSVKQEYEKGEERRKALLGAAQAAEPGSAPGVEAKPVPGSGRRDDSNGPGTSTTPPKPKPQRILTRKEQAAHDIALLRAAAEKDARASKH